MSDWEDDDKPIAKKPAPKKNDDDWGPETKSVSNGGNNDDWGSNAKPSAAKSNDDDDWGEGAKSGGGNDYGKTDYSSGGSGRGGRGGLRGGRSNGTERNGYNREGGGQAFGGDDKWDCVCGFQNFASRRQCKNCNLAKPGSEGGGQAFGGDDKWDCACGFQNFASRRQCKNCNLAKPGSEDVKDEEKWTCSGCNFANFASRRQCKECELAKPLAEGEKPREMYIPPEPSTDEKEMFGNAISAGINFDQFDDIEVTVSGNAAEAIKPIMTFGSAGLREILLENVEKSGYKKPTPIQKHAIPIVMAKRDLISCAQTGSGKTAAFVLPILNAIMNDNSDLSPGKPQCLIVAPTRELVIQIFDEARKFANKSWVKVSLAYGGTASRHQGDNITKGCHVLVATPGRLMDFVQKGTVTFEDLKFLVLDEADRMLDMGFKTEIEKIANHPKFNKDSIQTLMFSATFPEEIQILASQFLRDYIFLAVGIVGSASTDVEQEFLEVAKKEKRNKLGEILKEYIDNSEEDRILVFVETKKTADFLASFMSQTKMSSTSIHGDRLQREREEALRDFRSGKRKVLIATSVAARGLDIKGVTHVINYDLPKDIQDYVHRIGRTGRVGNRGKATSFYDDEINNTLAGDLARILKEAKQPIPEFLGGEAASCSGGHDAYGGTDIRQDVPTATKGADEEDWD